MHYYALTRREMVKRADGQPLSAEDIGLLKQEGATSIQEDSNEISAIEILNTENLSDKYSVKTIRQELAEIGVEQTYRLSRARALLSWNKSLQYCCTCGNKLEFSKDQTAKVCPTCNKMYFPRIEPCIIVLVYKGDNVLLARHANRNTDVYSCLAGFVEAGETIEHAVAREIFEETAIKVKNISYRGSQSWPFPDQLMLAFTAEYESGEIKVQESEIADAGWFDRESCPASPKPGSIAYKLIHQEI